MLQKLTRQFPTAVANLNNQQISPVFRNFNRVSLYVIPQCAIGRDEKALTGSLKDYLNFFARLSPSAAPRPKCLLILLGDMNSPCNYERLFEYAWDKKFLDFSVLKVNVPTDTALLHYFNPFFRIINVYVYDSLSVQIFPDKLRNANGYPLRVPAFRLRGYFNFTRDESGRILAAKGIRYRLTKMFAKKLNLTIDFAVDLTEHKTSASMYGAAIENLKTGALNMITIPIPKLDIHSSFANSILVLDQGYMHEDIVAVVPILNDASKKNFSSRLLFVGFMLSVTVTILTNIIKRIWKISWTDYRVLDVFGLLVGATVMMKPRKFVDRLICFSIFVIYIRYSTELHSKFTKVRVVDEHLFLDTFKAIGDSDFNVYITDVMYNQTFRSFDYQLEKVKMKTIKLDDISTCVDTLRTSRNVVCIMTKTLAKGFAKMYGDSYGNPIMKIAKPVFASDSVVYLFQGGSPYVEKLRDFLVRMYESGLYHVIVNSRHSSMIVNDNRDKDIKINSSLVQIMLIFGSGCMFSLTVFVIELIIFYSKCNK